ncbi:MAG: thrombospondin type 3 repeat-containing protein [Verrucomicrobia bacterium]|nr:thrombospondin type 3 repeat-containing protein [Verrucomicrobiota bacterium]
MAGFGEASPLQLERSLIYNGPATKALSVGSLSLSELAAVFNFEESVGLAVNLFGRFPLRWLGGVIEDGGIRGAQFDFRSTGLPLPGVSAAYSGFAIDFSRAQGVRIPFHGEFSLTDGTASPLLLRVPRQRPLWLELRPNGSVSLGGRAEASFPNGGKFLVDLLLDDPTYHLQIFGRNLHVSALSGLADLLPANPAVCLQNQTTDAQLTVATRCLEAFARAYSNFHASVRAASTFEGQGGTEVFAPPSPFDTASSVLQAWGFSALAPTTQNLPLDGIQDLLDQMGRAASGAAALPGVLQYRLALKRAKLAVEQGGLAGGAEARGRLEQALEEAEAAAIARAGDPETLRSLACLHQAMRLLLETDGLRAQLNEPPGTLMTSAIPNLLKRFMRRFTSDLNVSAGSFLPDTNPVIQEMNRFVAFDTLNQLFEILSDAALMGVTGPFDAPVAELLAQLALRLHTLANEALLRAEAAGDVPGFTFAFTDLVELIRYRELAIFPDVSGLPTFVSIPGFAQRLDALLQSDLGRPVGDRSLNSQAAEIGALLRLLREMPASVSFAAPPFERAYDRLESALDQSLTTLSIEERLPVLLKLLQAGTLHAELGRRFNLTRPADWETQRLPLVAARIGAVAVAQSGGSELSQAVSLLLSQADRLGLLENDQARRKRYLEQASVLLGSGRLLNQALFRAEETNLGLRIADLVLPGEIEVANAAGSIRYHRLTQVLNGAFRGTLRLPKFGLGLTINNASFSTGGSFDINAFGTVRLPIGDLSISPRTPLHLSFRPANALSISGGGTLDLDNGLSFTGRLILEDPIYGLYLAAEGLRFRLAQDLVLLWPALEEDAIRAFSSASRETFNEYLTGLSSTLESLAGAAATLPAVDSDTIGEPPEFKAPQVEIPLGGVSAWANSVLFKIAAGVETDYQSTSRSLIGSFENLSNELRSTRESLEGSAEILENQMVRLQVIKRTRQALDELEQRNLFDPNVVEEYERVYREGLIQEIKLAIQFYNPSIASDLGKTFLGARALLALESERSDAGVAFEDFDGDGVADSVSGGDNCPFIPNPEQVDQDNDGFGDGCDPEPANPNVPGNDPCARLALAGSKIGEYVPLLVNCALDREFSKAAINPRTGAVTNTSQLQNALLNEDQADELITILSQILGDGILLGINPEDYQNGLLTLIRARREQIRAEFDATALPQGIARYYTLGRLFLGYARIEEDLGGESADVTATSVVSAVNQQIGLHLTKDRFAELEREADAFLQERRRRFERIASLKLNLDGQPSDLDRFLIESPGFLFDLSEFVRVLGQQTDPAFKETVSEYVEFKLNELSKRTISPRFLLGKVHDGIALLDALTAASEWARQEVPRAAGLRELARVNLQNLTREFTEVAEAQKAWWWLRQYTDRLLQASSRYQNDLDTSLHVAVNQAAADSLVAANRIAGSLIQLIGQVQIDSVTFQPQFTLCGTASPKLFGIPLASDVVEIQASATRNSFAARFAISPSYILLNSALCSYSLFTACTPVFPALDNAGMGFSIAFPDPAEFILGGLSGRFRSPAALGNFAEEGFEFMLNNATFTVDYEFSPFGFQAFRSEARVFMPSFEFHPSRPDIG